MEEGLIAALPTDLACRALEQLVDGRAHGGARLTGHQVDGPPWFQAGLARCAVGKRLQAGGKPTLVPTGDLPFAQVRVQGLSCCGGRLNAAAEKIYGIVNKVPEYFV